jgi:hypothetical protein
LEHGTSTSPLLDDHVKIHLIGLAQRELETCLDGLRHLDDAQNLILCDNSSFGTVFNSITMNNIANVVQLGGYISYSRDSCLVNGVSLI